MTEDKRKYSGFIVRGQPWHTGHQRYLEEMAAEGHQPVLFLGSSNADRNRTSNPFSTNERIAIITKACEKLRYPDGKKVAPIFVPIYDFPRGPAEKPYQENGEKLVPPNSKWFAQFTKFFIDNNIAPEDFTLYYAAKDKDKKNYVFYPRDLPGVTEKLVVRDEDLSYAFTLLGVKRRQVELTDENATDIRENLHGKKHFLVDGCDDVIRDILARERTKNADYDGRDITDEAFDADPMQVLRHERRVHEEELRKPPSDPGFHKRVLIVGSEGAISPAIIDNLLAAGHDLVLSSSKAGTVEELSAKYPKADIARTRQEEFWVDLYKKHDIDAVINLAGIISEKPEEGLTFDAINYRPVPAMAAACVECGIDRYIYFSTQTAATDEAEENARQTEKPLTYAGSKRKAELALEKFAGDLNSFTVRPVTTYDPKSPDWGRAMTLPDLANLPVVPVWGSGTQEMQPVSIDDLAKIGRLVESPDKGARILDVVGPEQLTLAKILRTVRRLRGDFPAIHIPYDRALRLADHYPLGGINRSFIRVMQGREEHTPLIDSKPWTHAVGETKLTTLRAAYNHAAAGDLPMPRPPVRAYAEQIAKKPDEFYALLRDSGADEALLGSVRDVFEKLAAGQEPQLSKLEAAALLKKVIETLGSGPAPQ